jgi:hypothetical protein
MGGLADTRVYKEVAWAKLSTKQNSICLWWLWGIWEDRSTTRTWWGLCSNPRTCPMVSDKIHGPMAQKMVMQHPDKFWTSNCFDDSHHLKYDFDMKLFPLCSHPKLAQGWSGWRHWSDQCPSTVWPVGRLVADPATATPVWPVCLTGLTGGPRIRVELRSPCEFRVVKGFLAGQDLPTL